MNTKISFYVYLHLFSYLNVYSSTSVENMRSNATERKTRNRDKCHKCKLTTNCLTL